MTILINIGLFCLHWILKIFIFIFTWPFKYLNKYYWMLFFGVTVLLIIEAIQLVDDYYITPHNHLAVWHWLFDFHNQKIFAIILIIIFASAIINLGFYLYQITKNFLHTKSLRDKLLLPLTILKKPVDPSYASLSLAEKIHLLELSHHNHHQGDNYA